MDNPPSDPAPPSTDLESESERLLRHLKEKFPNASAADLAEAIALATNVQISAINKEQ
jgi:hypothetical protein